MNKELVKIQKNGTKIWKITEKCMKCNGKGYIPYYAQIDDGVCFDCKGTGLVSWEEEELTPEAQAKQDAIRKAEAEKRAAEYMAKEIDRCHRQALIENKWFDKHQAEVNASKWQGEVGDKITVKIINSRSTEFETHFGYNTLHMYIHIMKDEEGNTYTWKTQNPLGYYVEADERHCSMIDKKGRCWNWYCIEDDEAFMITGTVKEHTTYNDVKQTVLTRCKIKAAE